MHDNSSPPGPTHPAAATVRRTRRPLAETTRVGRYLADLTRGRPEMLRLCAARRAEVVIMFVRQHEDDFARAGLPVDRRASLTVRSATLREAVARQNWDEVRATAAEIAMDLGAYLSTGPTKDGPSTPNPPASRTADLLQRLRRHWSRTSDAADLVGGGAAEDEPAAPEV